MKGYLTGWLPSIPSWSSSSSPSVAPKSEASSSKGNAAAREEGSDVTGTVLKTTGAGAVGAVVASKVATFGLWLYGFGSGGVAAKSFAALWQSGIGNVAAGSTFAWLQQAAATGVAITGPVGAAGVAVAGGGYLGWRKWFSSKGNATEDEEVKCSKCGK